MQVFGSQKYAVRIQVDPDALAARGIGVDEVQEAVAAANANTPVGTLQNQPQNLTIQAQTAARRTPTQFRNLIVATRDGQPVRLGDVATRDRIRSRTTRPPAGTTAAASIVLAVQRQPDANTVEVVDRVKAHAAAVRRDSCRRGARHQRAQRPLDLDPRGGARRAAHAAC